MFFQYSSLTKSDQEFNALAVAVKVICLLLISGSMGYIVYNCVKDCRKRKAALELPLTNAPSI